MKAMNYIHRNETEIVAAIEYHPCGNFYMPHSVFTVNARNISWVQVYDFDWCERDGNLYFHNSGGGGSVYLNPMAEPKEKPLCCYWYEPKLVIPTDAGNHRIKLSPLKITSWGYDIVAAPLTLDFDNGEQNPFRFGYESDVEYCGKCKDHLPEDNLCDHIWWCERCARYSSPGERCKHRRPK